MLETLQIISLIICIPASAFSLLVILCKPFRKWIVTSKNNKGKMQQDEEDRKETDRCLLRDRITSIYYKNRLDCELRQYEYENLERLYKQYKKLGGNSFVDKIWNEIQDWNILS